MIKLVAGLILIILALGLLPFALIARSRASQNANQPVHLVLDMDKQPKYKAQRESAMFADHRSMRPEVLGVVAREDLAINSEVLDDPLNPRLVGGLAGGRTSIQLDDPTTYAAVMLGRVRPAGGRGMTDAQFDALTPPNKTDQEVADDKTFYVRRIPATFTVSEEFLRRGQERFTIYCAPCHGESGYGDGPTAVRAERLRTTVDAINGWTRPQNLHEAKILTRPDGHIFNTITNGVRTMPAYDKQISVPDRWAIVAYLRALQRSQDAQPGDVAAAGAGK